MKSLVFIGLFLLGFLNLTTLVKSQIMLVDRPMFNFPNYNAFNSSQSFVSVTKNDLKFPHILKIQVMGGKIDAELNINGKITEKIKDDSYQINLSPYLFLGKNTIELSGNHTTNSSIRIEFSGPNTSTNQQTSGNTTFRQILTVLVVE